MKPISPFSLVLPNSSRRRFIQGLAAGGVMMDLLPFLNYWRGRVLGSGLSDLSAGLRLRYEVRREFAPYLGVEWARKFGETEDFARAAGEDTSDTRFVAGLRFWF